MLLFFWNQTVKACYFCCRMVHSTDIVEFELRSKRFSLAVRKKEALVQPEPMYLPVRSSAVHTHSSPPAMMFARHIVKTTVLHACACPSIFVMAPPKARLSFD